MGEKTGIAWTQHTWNPWQGCIKVSAGCANCYMFREKTRYGQDPSTVVRSLRQTFNQPRKWQRRFIMQEEGGIRRRRELVFVCSWSDFFILEADWWRDEAWKIIRDCPSFIFQILTKRPERIAECLPADWGDGYPNVWLGVTAENQEAADKRISLLLDIPDWSPGKQQVRFVSCEPLLESVSLLPWLGVDATRRGVRGIGWVIAGCESGPGRRPMAEEWALQLLAECVIKQVPFFFKQAERDGNVVARPELYGQTWAEFPKEATR